VAGEGDRWGMGDDSRLLWRGGGERDCLRWGELDRGATRWWVWIMEGGGGGGGDDRRSGDRGRSNWCGWWSAGEVDRGVWWRGESRGGRDSRSSPGGECRDGMEWGEGDLLMVECGITVAGVVVWSILPKISSFENFKLQIIQDLNSNESSLNKFQRRQNKCKFDHSRILTISRNYLSSLCPIITQSMSSSQETAHITTCAECRQLERPDDIFVRSAGVRVI